MHRPGLVIQLAERRWSMLEALGFSPRPAQNGRALGIPALGRRFRSSQSPMAIKQIGSHPYLQETVSQ